MTLLRNSIALARNRLGLDLALRFAGRFCAAATGLTALAIVALRAAGFDLPTAWPWWRLALPALAAVLAGACFGWLQRPGRLQAAILLDRQMHLKDRIGTAESIRQGKVRDQAFAALASQDAERLLQRITVAAAVPVRVGGAWGLTLLAASLVTAAYMWMPVLERASSPGADAVALSPAQQQALRQTGRQIAQTIEAAAEPLREQPQDPRAAEQLAALDRLAEQIAAPVGSPVQMQQARDESAARLNELAEGLAQRSRGELDAADQLARRFDGLQPRPDRPLNEQQLVDALRRGEFGQAADALTQLFESARSPVERRRLAELLRETSEQVKADKQSANIDGQRDLGDLRDMLRNQGVDERTIERIAAAAESAPQEREPGRSRASDQEPSPSEQISPEAVPPSPLQQPSQAQSTDTAPPHSAPVSEERAAPPSAPRLSEEIRRELEQGGVDPELADRLARQIEQARQREQAQDQAREDAQELSRALDDAASEAQSPPNPETSPSAPPAPSSPPKDQARSPHEQQQPDEQRPQDEARRADKPDSASDVSEPKQSTDQSASASKERGGAEKARSTRREASPQQDRESRPSAKQQGHAANQQTSDAAEPSRADSPSGSRDGQRQDGSAGAAQREDTRPERSGPVAQRDEGQQVTEAGQQPSSPSSSATKARQDQQVTEAAGKGQPASKDVAAAGQKPDVSDKSRAQPGPSQTPQQDQLPRDLATPKSDAPAPDPRTKDSSRAGQKQDTGLKEQAGSPGAREPQLGDRDSGAVTEQHEAPPSPSQTGEPSPNVDRPSPQAQGGPGKSLMDKLRELDQRRREAARQQAAAEDLRRRAREIADNLTDDERRRLEAWTRQRQRERGSQQQQEQGMPLDPSRLLGQSGEAGNVPGSPGFVHGSGPPSVLRSGSAEVVDARGPIDPNAPGDQIIAEWLSSDDAPRPPDAAATTQQRLESARRAAERAVNEQSVNRRYHELIQRYFRGIDKTVAPDAKPQPAPSTTP